MEDIERKNEKNRLVSRLSCGFDLLNVSRYTNDCHLYNIHIRCLILSVSSYCMYYVRRSFSIHIKNKNDLTAAVAAVEMLLSISCTRTVVAVQSTTCSYTHIII